jgi:hypothetical protein
LASGVFLSRNGCHHEDRALSRQFDLRRFIVRAVAVFHFPLRLFWQREDYKPRIIIGANKEAIVSRGP